MIFTFLPREDNLIEEKFNMGVFAKTIYLFRQTERKDPFNYSQRKSFKYIPHWVIFHRVNIYIKEKHLISIPHKYNDEYILPGLSSRNNLYLLIRIKKKHSIS